MPPSLDPEVPEFDEATLAALSREQLELLARREKEARLAAEASHRLTLLDLEAARAGLLKAQRMATLGQLTAGVAHELNTPLGIAVTAGSHLKVEIKQLMSTSLGEIDPEEYEESLEAVLEASELLMSNVLRATELVNRFKRMAMGEKAALPVEFDIKEHIDSLLKSLGPLFADLPVEVRVECPAHIRVRSYPGPLSEVVTNLLTNALRHAFPEGAPGGIQIDVKEEGKQLLLSFVDDGVGMSSEVCERVFDPFFTTRRGRGGMGLGMHLVYNLVTQQLRGTIEVQSSPGEGTAFFVRIPRAPTPSMFPPAP